MLTVYTEKESVDLGKYGKYYKLFHVIDVYLLRKIYKY